MSMLHVHVMLLVRVHAACPVVRVHALCPRPCCLYMSMLYACIQKSGNEYFEANQSELKQIFHNLDLLRFEVNIFKRIKAN
jgi:hypothetical protein